MDPGVDHEGKRSWRDEVNPFFFRNCSVKTSRPSDIDSTGQRKHESVAWLEAVTVNAPVV